MPFTMPQADLHSFDGRLTDDVYDFVEAFNVDDLPTLQQTLEEMKNFVMDPKKNIENYEFRTRMLSSVDIFRQEQRDPCNRNISTSDAVRIAWHLARLNGSESIVMQMLDDMAVTSGYCIQGRVVRMLQVIGCLAANEPLKK